jgi:2-oxo-3-hexenedioate decarboxylase
MYASTVHPLANQEASVSRAAFCQPRIEPEIMERVARAPAAAEPEAIAAALEWVAHGFEIVDSHAANWKFKVADTVADFGLHGALFIGAPQAAVEIADIVTTLSSLDVELSRNGTVVDRGRGSNVLDGPLQAIAHLMRVLAAQDRFPSLGAGEIITTGTLTAAWPVEAGQRWSTRLAGIGLPGAALSFT